MFSRNKDKVPSLKAVDRPGSLSVPGEFATVPCHVVRMSDTQAVLRLDRPRRLPASFRLTIRGDSRSRVCEMVSAKQQDIQVRFAG
jgi:hypothetical protein